MQALAERLHDALAGKRLAGADALQFSALKTFDPPASSVAGLVLESVTRRGKYLILSFGSLRMLIHLSQGGRVDIEIPPKRTRPKGAVVRLRFEGGPGVLVKEYGTERKAAWWVLRPDDDGPLEGLGPEPFDDAFAQIVAESRDKRRIHTWLRDQRTVAGIGRGYSDDILHAARLSPYATLASMSEANRDRLVASARAVLEDALTEERKRTGGLPTKLGERFRIHRHSGTPCPVCGETLRRVSYEGYEIVYCPRCQTGGKVLADRRLSRLLK